MSYRLNVLRVLVLGVAVATGAAARAESVRLHFMPDPEPKKIIVWEDFSSSTIRPPDPFEYELSWKDGDVTRDIVIHISWESQSEELPLRLTHRHTRETVSLPLKEPLFESGFDEAAAHCRDVVASSYSTLIPLYLTCRELFQRTSDGSFYRFWALKGWLDTAYRLTTGHNSPFQWDTNVQKIIEEFEAKANSDPDSNFAIKYRKVFPKTYVDRLLSQVRQSQLMIVQEVPTLIKEGRLEEALAVNKSAMEIYSDVSAETGLSVVNGINAQLLEDNERYIRGRLGGDKG
ncbi:hypothetical protein [Methyloligella solikamskensis]|uniref:Uncharacterized protein n=1 Tax=Methyloligella solikamskensis TaxID=1177756 RepID=A0ABW3J6Z0_9HYPH